MLAVLRSSINSKNPLDILKSSLGKTRLIIYFDKLKVEICVGLCGKGIFDTHKNASFAGRSECSFVLRTGIQFQTKFVVFVLLIITAVWIFNNQSLACKKYFFCIFIWNKYMNQHIWFKMRVKSNYRKYSTSGHFKLPVTVNSWGRWNIIW